MNPMDMVKLLSLKKDFEDRHPKAVAFFKREIASGSIPAGTVVELSLTRPGQPPVSCNFRILEEDLEMVQSLKALNPGGN